MRGFHLSLRWPMWQQASRSSFSVGIGIEVEETMEEILGGYPASTCLGRRIRVVRHPSICRQPVADSSLRVTLRVRTATIDRTDERSVRICESRSTVYAEKSRTLVASRERSILGYTPFFAQFLRLFPHPQGHGALRPIFSSWVIVVPGTSRYACVSNASTISIVILLFLGIAAPLIAGGRAVSCPPLRCRGGGVSRCSNVRTI